MKYSRVCSQEEIAEEIRRNNNLKDEFFDYKNIIQKKIEEDSLINMWRAYIPGGEKLFDDTRYSKSDLRKLARLLKNQTDYINSLSQQNYALTFGIKTTECVLFEVIDFWADLIKKGISFEVPSQARSVLYSIYNNRIMTYEARLHPSYNMTKILDEIQKDSLLCIFVPFIGEPSHRRAYPLQKNTITYCEVLPPTSIGVPHIEYEINYNSIW